MKFPYKQLARGAFRPIIPITVCNPRDGKSIRYLALVDSGADNCIFATEIGGLIGLDITSGAPSTVSGVVAGASRPYYLHEVEIEVGGFAHKATVGFMPALSKNGHGFVGRVGFFERFAFVKFGEPKHTVELGARIS